MGLDIVDLREGDAGDPGDAAAEAEGERIDDRRADPHRGGHAPVLGDGAHRKAEAGDAEGQHQEPDHGGGEGDDPEPVEGEREAAQLDGAAHPGGRGDVHVGRAEERAHRLLKDQAEPPGGEQRLERAAIEEADQGLLDDDAEDAGDDEGGRNREQKAPVRDGGEEGRDELLDDEGGVGADHHDLAVRHVDHAHHAEGDGQPSGGEEEDRAEAQAVIDRLEDVPEGQHAVDMLDRGGGGGGDGGRGAGERGEDAAGGEVVARADEADGGELFGDGRCRGFQARGGFGLGQDGAHSRIRLMGEGAGDEREGIRIRGLEERLGRLPAHRDRAREEIEHALRRGDRAADHVVDDDRADDREGRRRDRLAGARVDEIAVRLLDEEAVVGARPAPGEEAVVGEGGDDDAGARIAGGGERGDRVLDGLEIGRGEAGEGVGRARRPRRLREGEEENEPGDEQERCEP